MNEESRAEPEKESETLLNELEKIYFKVGWRKDKNAVKRVTDIKKRLGEIFAEA